MNGWRPENQHGRQVRKEKEHDKNEMGGRGREICFSSYERGQLRKVAAFLRKVVTATNVYNSRRICTWSAGMATANQIRFDVEPADTTVSGEVLGCSFILLGK